MQSSANAAHHILPAGTHFFFTDLHFSLSLQPTKRRSSYSKVFAACLTQLPPDARVRGQGWGEKRPSWRISSTPRQHPGRRLDLAWRGALGEKPPRLNAKRQGKQTAITIADNVN